MAERRDWTAGECEATTRRGAIARSLDGDPAIPGEAPRLRYLGYRPVSFLKMR